MYASVRVMILIWFPICRPLFLSTGTILRLLLLLLLFFLFFIVIMIMPDVSSGSLEPLCSSTWSTMGFRV